MKFRTMVNFTFLVAGLVVFSNASAGAITCGGAPLDRTATLTSATSCTEGLGNPGLADILADYSGESWSGAGQLVVDGTNDYLTVSLTSGSWGAAPIEADWEISSDFWSNYAEAVISIHVGNGAGDPDYFAWSIMDNATTGTLSYEILTGNGGGLSNMKLWGRGTASVPAPATVALLGLGLMGLVLSRKRKPA